jgi:predicted TIM-barrel fold metal-dependent hydrolase
MDLPVYNCHAHTFTSCDVPDDFLPWKLAPLLRRFGLVRPLARFLRGAIPFLDNDLFDRYAAILDISHQPSQAVTFEILRGLSPEHSRFVVLAMDMEYMGAGRLPRPYRAQLDELSRVRSQYPDQVLPFVAADPRRPGVLELVREYIEQHHFHGIKLYPSLGYYPFDQCLWPVYQYAQDKQIPIISHCSPGGVYYRGPITDDLLVHPRTGRALRRAPHKAFAANFAHPDNYTYVLKDFPGLKICLAHFGGETEWRTYLVNPWDPQRARHPSWFRIILEMLTTYPGVYADIAYTLHDPGLFRLLKVVMLNGDARRKVLYGSDFYLVQLERSERSFGLGVRAALGEADFSQIAHTNAVAFLSSAIWPL